MNKVLFWIAIAVIIVVVVVAVGAFAPAIIKYETSRISKSETNTPTPAPQDLSLLPGQLNDSWVFEVKGPGRPPRTWMQVVDVQGAWTTVDGFPPWGGSTQMLADNSNRIWTRGDLDSQAELLFDLSDGAGSSFTSDARHPECFNGAVFEVDQTQVQTPAGVFDGWSVNLRHGICKDLKPESFHFSLGLGLTAYTFVDHFGLVEGRLVEARVQGDDLSKATRPD